MGYITEEVPCISFENIENINIVRGPVCSSELGKRLYRGAQRFILNGGCFTEDISKVVHELWHSLG